MLCWRGTEKISWTDCARNEEVLQRMKERNILQMIKRRNSWFHTFTLFGMLYAFFWVIPQRLNFICRRFGTMCLFHLHRQVGMKNDFFIPTRQKKASNKRRNAKWTGQIWHRSCLLKHLSKGKIKGRTDATGRWGRRHRAVTATGWL